MCKDCGDRLAKDTRARAVTALHITTAPAAARDVRKHRGMSAPRGHCDWSSWEGIDGTGGYSRCTWRTYRPVLSLLAEQRPRSSQVKSEDVVVCGMYVCVLGTFVYNRAGLIVSGELRQLPSGFPAAAQCPWGKLLNKKAAGSCLTA